jgi:hypothetical protein
MNAVEELIVGCKIEEAENRIRALHNDLESRRLFGKKHYMPYDSRKFIAMVKDVHDIAISKPKEAV